MDKLSFSELIDQEHPRHESDCWYNFSTKIPQYLTDVLDSVPYPADPQQQEFWIKGAIAWLRLNGATVNQGRDSQNNLGFRLNHGGNTILFPPADPASFKPALEAPPRTDDPNVKPWLEAFWKADWAWMERQIDLPVPIFYWHGRDSDSVSSDCPYQLVQMKEVFDCILAQPTMNYSKDCAMRDLLSQFDKDTQEQARENYFGPAQGFFRASDFYIAHRQTIALLEQTPQPSAKTNSRRL